MWDCGNQEFYPLSFGSFTFYFMCLINQVSLPFFVLFVVAFIMFIFSKNKKRNIFIFGMIIPYLIHTFISVKWGRYILPLISSLSLITAWWIDSLKKNYIKTSLVLIIIIYGVSLHYFTSWRILYFHFPFFYNRIFHISQPPYPPDNIGLSNDLYFQEIVSQIRVDLKNKEQITIGFSYEIKDIIIYLWQHLYFNFNNEFIKERIMIKNIDFLDIEETGYIVLDKDEWLKNSSLYRDYNIIKQYKIKKYLTCVILRNEMVFSN